MKVGRKVRLISIALAGIGLPRAALAERQTVPLTDGWHFHLGASDADGDPSRSDFDDRGWTIVSLPHSWNRVGNYAPQTGIATRKTDKTLGVGWYRLVLAGPNIRPGEKVWLQFEAASRIAQVWLNGHVLGAHSGGFSRFRLDATPFWQTGGRNVVAVKVDNSAPVAGASTADNLPLAGDFAVYGGLYRGVSLIVTPPAHFDMTDDGGPGIVAETRAIGPASAQLAVTAKLRGKPGAYRLRLQLRDAQGKSVAQVQQAVTIPASGALDIGRTLTVRRPHLWQGTRAPYLYRLVAQLQDGNSAGDRIAQDIGIRQFRLDAQRGFLLNGKPYPLRGVALHQGTMQDGWASSARETESVFQTMLDMGANSLRLSHYQHGETIHRLADRHGIVLWDEIPLVTAWTVANDQASASPGLLANARQQLRELIAQNRNHASVAVWGIANEVDFGPNLPGFLNTGRTQPPDPRPLLGELDRLAHTLDPARPTALATCCEDNRMPDVPIVADTVDAAGVNRYFGWYYGKPQDLGPHLDALHAKRPAQPLAVTEYGAGGAISIHSDNVLGGPVDATGVKQPEEYQAWLHEQSWAQLAARPYLWATYVWNGYDFSSQVRREGDAVDINTKGLVSYDGAVRKDAFYFYRAQWSASPTVHITGRRYAERAYGVSDIKVYSNAPRTSLRINGRLVGTLQDCPHHVCLWHDVRLDEGENRIAATGDFAQGSQSDAIAWHLAAPQAKAFRIDAGSIVAAASQGGLFGSDTFFQGGEAATADETPRFRPPVPAKIVGSADRDLLATYREGRFAYRIPALPGRYTVTLEFVEPKAGAGERVFDVMANGTAVVSGLDIAAAAGGPLQALSRSFPVTVGTAGLDLAFVPRQGQAIVSAIIVEPAR